MKIAQIQTCPVLGDEEHNINEIENYLAKCKGADIIILPELANSGYNFVTRENAALFAVDNHHDKYINFLKSHASQLNCVIISGYFEVCSDKYYNSSILVKPDGSTTNYRKVHLFMNEKNIFEPGDIGFPVTEYKDVKIGMLVCFDYLFPEAWRILALKGAEIIAHPANLVTLNARKVVPAQAIMNRVFVATTNRVGVDNGLVFNGNSSVCNPTGDIISHFNETETGTLLTDINPEEAKNKMITELNHVINDRHPEMYSGLI